MFCRFGILLTFSLYAVVLSYGRNDQSNGNVQLMFQDYNTQNAMQSEICSDDDNNIGDSQYIFEYLYDGIRTYKRPEQNGQEYVAQMQKHPDYQKAVDKCQYDQPKAKPCDPQSPYRTYDGSCNNLWNPTWGMKGECMQRWLGIYYEGSSGLRQSVKGGPLPLPRDVSENLFGKKNTPSNASFLLPLFGQFIAHEISLTTPRIGKKSKTKCCPVSKENDATCNPIILRKNDTFYSKYGVTCIDNTRTPPCKTCNIGKRNQANQRTAAIDGSQIYGTSEKEANQLRLLDGSGKLKSKKTLGGELLPPADNPDDDFCQVPTQACFKAGDVRVNQHSPLMSLHTVFLREHNRVAEKLKKLNPNWDEETLFQETRKIVVAELQATAYGELLPLLIGSDYMQDFNLWIKSDGTFTRYDPYVRIGAWSEFSTCAYRLHTLISSDTGFRNWKFWQFYSNPYVLHGGQMKQLFSSLSKHYAQVYGVWLVDDMRNLLYRGPLSYYGYDMGSVTINRGRDHGVAPYVEAVKFCSNGLVNINTFDDLRSFMVKEDVDKLKKNYKSVIDIDLWVGMQKENLIPGALVGPTAACLIATQFRSLKYGDRFYFEHQGEVPSFTPDQIQALRKTTFSRILCDNTKIDKIQLNALKLPGGDNPITPCKRIPQMDLSPWKEADAC